MRQSSRLGAFAAWIGGELGVLVVAGLAPLAEAQSLNIRFGSAASTPAATYAGAGIAGAWNSLAAVPPDYVRVPLVNLQGSPSAAQLYQSGSASVFTFNNPLTGGDDERLMDSMMLSTNNPTDGCFWVEGLTPGPYEVTIYAMTPNSTTLQNRTRVDNGSPGPTMVGGTWPGHHQQGVTYSRFTVTTTDGTIAFHDGLYGGVLQSGMNGVQFRFLGPCSTASFSGQPASAISCRTGSAPFSVTATGTGPFTYQWQVQTAPGFWQSMGNDPAPLPCGGGAFSYASPINSPNVSIGLRPCPSATPGAPQHFQIRCIATNACGPATSNEATYTICPADFNCSGALTVNDIFDFLATWFAGTPSADFNGAGGTTVQDIFDFLGAWFAGC
jgi:hypothetical protein